MTTPFEAALAAYKVSSFAASARIYPRIPHPHLHSSHPLTSHLPAPEKTVIHDRKQTPPGEYTIQNLADRSQQITIVPGLGNELVNQPSVYGRNNGCRIFITGENNPFSFRPAPENFTQEYNSVHRRHAVSGNHQLERT